MREQRKILSHTMKRVLSMLEEVLPDEKVYPWNGEVSEGVTLYVYGVEQAKNRNMMESLKIIKSDKEKGDVEYLVPVPQMVFLNIALVPCYTEYPKALDVNSALIGHLGENPYVDLDELSWHGNDEGRANIEVLSSSALGDLPTELKRFNSFKWNVRVELGINSSREERVSRVITRQFAAVNK